MHLTPAHPATRASLLLRISRSLCLAHDTVTSVTSHRVAGTAAATPSAASGRGQVPGCG